MRPTILGLLIAISTSLAAHAADFQLTSPSFKEGATIPNAQVFKGFGCTGDNISPALSWSGVPKEAKSLAITVYDPDAPTGSGWWHWIVVNIPVAESGLAEGAGSGNGKLPAGAVQGRTDFGTAGYGGPCPPQGDPPHHYIFTLWAVTADKLDVDSNSSGALAGYMLHFNNAGKAVLTGRYGR